MNRLAAWFLFWLMVVVAVRATAQLEMIPHVETQRVFSGSNQHVKVAFVNRGDNVVRLETKTALVQLSSATALRLSESEWKTLKVLPGQTIIESVSVPFPVVKAASEFLIQWFTSSNQILATVEVLAFPTNLLSELQILAGHEPLGVFDPTDELKLLLYAQSVAFHDLVEDGTDKFFGRLAVFGPFTASRQVRAGLGKDIRALAKRGVAVVWLQPPPDQHASLRPSFYTVRTGPGAIVIAQREMVARLAERPEAQLNLIQLAKSAVRPARLDLPDSENPP